MIQRALTSKHINPYTSEFMDYADISSQYSAQAIIYILLQNLSINSVLDIGCAKGTWLAEWYKQGVEMIHGVDGEYIDLNTLRISSDLFTSQDLSKSFQLGKRFDVVQSLEVAEHIHQEYADCFIENIVKHSSGLILFSSAPPGQGGAHHINEQPYEYWRNKFAKHGYEAYDLLRPIISKDMNISFWYRYNILLYIHESIVASLPVNIFTTKAKSNTPIADVSPLLFKLRKFIVKFIPNNLQARLAAYKAYSAQRI